MKKIKIVSLVLALVMMAGISGCKKEEQKVNQEENKKVETKNATDGNKTQVEGTETAPAADGGETTENQQNTTVTPVEEAESEPEKVYTPTFMYFVADTDANFAQTNETIEKLKKEYEGRVNFDIRNVTQDPSQLENFPVEGQTPALIMLNTNNDISNFLFMNGNYDDLKSAIEAALQ